MNITMFVLSFLATLSFGQNPPPEDGIFVYSTKYINLSTGQELKLLPDDTIFLYKGIGLEKVGPVPEHWKNLISKLN